MSGKIYFCIQSLYSQLAVFKWIRYKLMHLWIIHWDQRKMLVNKFSLLLFISSYLHALDLYYISPDAHNRSCVLNATVLQPCYSLDQLSNESHLLTNRTAVTLLLVQGHHVVQSDYIATAKVTEIKLRPRNDEEVIVECKPRAKFMFENVWHLVLRHVRFISCTFQMVRKCYRSDYTPYGLIFMLHVAKVEVENCVFIGNKHDHVINVTTLHCNDYIVNVSLNNCAFITNHGAVAISHLLFENPQISGILSAYSCEFINNDNCLDLNSIEVNIQKCNFTNNSAIQSNTEGSLSISLSSVLINDSHFRDSNISSGSGKIIVSLSSTLKIYRSHFENNTAICIMCVHHSLELNDVIFQNNFAALGSTIHSDSVGINITNCYFHNNFCNSSGAALLISNSFSSDQTITNTTFSNNQAVDNGGAIHCTQGRDLTIHNSSSTSNFATKGGFIYSNGCHIKLCKVNVTENNAMSGGGIYAVKTTLEICYDRREEELFLEFDDTSLPILSQVVFQNNTAISGGALFAEETDVEFMANVALIDNKADENGGAVFLNNSQIRNTGDGITIFSSNKATSKGGAIYVISNDCDIKSCFLHSPNVDRIVFRKNSATLGAALYGGKIDRCKSSWHFKLYSTIIFANESVSVIASDPVRICVSFDGTKPNCSIRHWRVGRMRGEVMTLTLSAVDQVEYPKTSHVVAYFKQSTPELNKGEKWQRIDQIGNVSYHVSTNLSEVTMLLAPEGICERSQFSSFSVHITLLPCSAGFEQTDDRCVCERRLKKIFHNRTVCDIDSRSISNKGSAWLAYESDYLKLHSHCPLDFCKQEPDYISFENSDLQCAHYRSGVICGQCQENYSVALGSNKCVTCSSKYSFIGLLLLFAVAGVVLVFVLLVFNMTTSSGTLNGLIFYANVVSISGLTSFHNCAVHPILSVFIAWVNLDFGVEVCFYPGMDTYQKTWLQFAFPLYIWTLVAAIIVAVHYSSRVMRIFGLNNIAVLATLFLISYTKILKTITTALNFTQVLMGSASNVSDPLLPYTVWKPDGNIEYLKEKHIILFIASLLILLIVFLPYTLLLIFGQCLRSMPIGRRFILGFTRSTAFVSILDAYHAPYNKRHRYWTGLMLLIRCVLFLAFSSFYRDNNVTANVYTTTLVIIGILIIKTCATDVYKNRWVSILETCFLANLSVLSATLYYLDSTEDIRCRATSTSIAVSFLLFFGILSYHAFVKLRKTRYFNIVYLKAREKFSGFSRNHDIPMDSNTTPPSSTMVELREELLASTN